MTWELIDPDERFGNGASPSCVRRLDDAGLWNFIKSWFIYGLHLLTCVLLYIVLLRFVDNHNFNTGSPPSFWNFEDGLYQTEVNGLISLGLVLIRLIGGACSSVLVWRVIFIFLEKSGITLAELSSLSSFRIPVIPRLETRNQFVWSFVMAVVVLLLWPPSVAAPLAGSSLAWVPSTTWQKQPSSLDIPAVGVNSDWGALLYADARMRIVLNAAVMALSDPAYAFDDSTLNATLRRYVPALAQEFNQGIADLSLPYFEVSFTWIDAPSDNRSINAGDAPFSEFSGNDPGIRYDGMVEILRGTKRYEENWPNPADSQIFTAEKLIAIKVNTIDDSLPLPWNNSLPDKSMPCAARSAQFEHLPTVKQQARDIFDGDTVTARDCFLVARASIIAGVRQGKRCHLSSSGPTIHSATCSSENSTTEPSMLTELSLDAMSEVIRYFLSLLPITTGTTSGNTWMRNDRGLDAYVRGVMALAYHASWSALAGILDDEAHLSEPETMLAYAAVPAVRAKIDKGRIGAWLGMNASLAMAALLLSLSAGWAKVKTVRNTALAALTVDMGDVCHDGRAKGLCNAVALSERDKKLPRLRWEDEGRAGSYCRRVSFVDQMDGEGVRLRSVGRVDENGETVHGNRAESGARDALLNTSR